MNKKRIKMQHEFHDEERHQHQQQQLELARLLNNDQV